MDWDEAHAATLRVVKGWIGRGFVDEYYAQLADELIGDLKLVEAQSTPQVPAPQVDPEELRKLLRLRDAIREIAG
jgi:hypothetical protein